jgi:hypothetical protein
MQKTDDVKTITPVIRNVPETVIWRNFNTDEIIISQHKKFVRIPVIYAEAVANNILREAGIMNFGGGK